MKTYKSLFQTFIFCLTFLCLQSSTYSQIEITYDTDIFTCSFGNVETASFNCNFNGSLSAEVVGVSELTFFIFDPVDVVDGNFSFSHNVGAPTSDIVEVIWTIESSDDATGCASAGTTISTMIQLDCLCAPTIQILPVMHESCYQCADGSGQLLASGMQEPITYEWSNGASTSTIANLAPGTYNLTATGSNLEPCTIVGSITIDAYECTSTQVQFSNQPVQCNGACEGMIEILGLENGDQITGVLWSDSSTELLREELCVGFYSGTVTTADNCPYIIETSIEEPELLELEVKDIIDSDGSETGSITVSANGGTPPYSYFVSQNGESIEHDSSMDQINNLEAGCYDILVIDNNMCSTGIDSVCVDNISSIQTLSKSDFNIYPNPCYQTLNIKKNQEYEIIKIDVMNILGEKQILLLNENKMDVSNLDNGIYIIAITTDHGHWVQQFVKSDTF